MSRSVHYWLPGRSGVAASAVDAHDAPTVSVVSPFYLALDQGMIMAAIGNELSGDLLRRAFSGPDMEQLVRPVISVESFNDTP